MTIITNAERARLSAERERQRFDHLVLGRARPKPVRSRKTRRSASATVELGAGIEERVQLRERWSHKAQGTPETHEHADIARQRPGSLARLYATGAIDADQLAAADEIAAAYRAITAGVAIKTASLEARIDGSGHGRAEAQALGAVYADFAYDWWRSAIGSAAEALLAIIVHDVGLTIVARRYGFSMPRARRLLAEALDLWWTGRGTTKRAARATLAPACP
jgi:hypothetical protein